MNDLSIPRQKAIEKWDLIIHNKIPVIYIGMASCGRAAGALEVLQAVEETLNTSSHIARIVEVGCIGPCYLEPLMDIQMPGEARVSFANVTPQKAREIIQKIVIEKQPYTKGAIGYLSVDGQKIPEEIPAFFDIPMLKSQVRLVLRNCGFINPEEIEHYLARDGYVGLTKALQMSPEAVLDEVKESGLRGRGGSGFPTARKWEICRSNPGNTKYLICNADEGDPGAFMNRSLIEGDPHAVLEGMLIAAYAIGATHGYIYIRAEYPLAIARLKKAIQQMTEYGLLGDRILDTEFNFHITLKEGAGAFVCGEETALIASIEGKRGMPRSRPPFPASQGLFGKPTVINNTETLGTLPNILRNGSEWYKQFGFQGNYGTKTFSLAGKVVRTGLIEVPLGTTLRQVIFDIGGGTKKPFKAVQTGGPSGGCLPASSLDLPLDYESLKAAGSIMGSGGLIVMDEDTCVINLAQYFLNFTKNESCGKCTPCRLGSMRLVEILDRISRGEGGLEDIVALKSLGETIQKGSLCGLGQTVPNPVITTLRYFEDEYLEHIQKHVCKAIVCKELIEFQIDTEKCTGCHQCSKVCPVEAISGKVKEKHFIDPDKCIHCRACYETCRFDAIHNTKSLEKMQAVSE
jgi:NADH:ubiquinone oxidoreductase subunit F (NADH-binding)/NAD-dependent dihydropyrimidine dehydrogenase PreA subunit/(2Fe-2S) ferredoxin